MPAMEYRNEERYKGELNTRLKISGTVGLGSKNSAEINCAPKRGLAEASNQGQNTKNISIHNYD